MKARRGLAAYYTGAQLQTRLPALRRTPGHEYESEIKVKWESLRIE